MLITRTGFKPTQLGIALLRTYNDIEIEMSSPTIRANNEEDFVKIVEGEKTKEEVAKLTR